MVKKYPQVPRTSRIAAIRNAAYLRIFKINKDAECVAQNGPGSSYNLTTGQCE